MKSEMKYGRWHKDFLKNIKIFENAGLSPDEASDFLLSFLKLSSQTPLPKVMNTFLKPDSFDDTGVYTERNESISGFMMKFLDPIMKNFTVVGTENLAKINLLSRDFPVTLISNHLSHLDAPGIFQLIHNASPQGKEVAEKLVFIAGRLAFEPDFTRLGLYMFGTLLVCSKKDMADNPSLSDIMTKINMRSFRHSQKLQSEGKIISIFPEGTRSRDGRLLEFVDTVYHYVANKIILPVALEGTDKILPTDGFILNQAKGKLVIGNPVLVGKLKPALMEKLPKDIEQIIFPDSSDQKQFIIDNLAMLVGKNLSRHQHGIYRNLYNGDMIDPDKNILIRKTDAPEDTVTLIGKSRMSTALACILSNKNILVRIYDPNTDYCRESQRDHRDIENYPIYKLPPNIEFTSNLADLENSTLFINASDPWDMNRVYKNTNEIFTANKSPFINASKGFTNSTSGLITDQLIESYGITTPNIAVLAGATYPDQIMERKISGLEIASGSAVVNNKIKDLLKTSYLFPRIAINAEDISGVQLGGALKSIYALSMGIVEGYFQSRLGGYLDNTLFHISDKFFREMVQLGTLMGGKKETFNGLSGLTDFMQSCFGSGSFNKSLGLRIANGENHLPMSSGVFGLGILDKFSQIDFNEFPVLNATYSIVIKKDSIDNTILKFQKLLA